MTAGVAASAMITWPIIAMLRRQTLRKNGQQKDQAGLQYKPFLHTNLKLSSRPHERLQNIGTKSASSTSTAIERMMASIEITTLYFVFDRSKMPCAPESGPPTTLTRLPATR